MHNQDHILFYSPVLKRMAITRGFKRPQPVLKQYDSICSRCSSPSITSVYHPRRKRFLDVNKSICQSGHVEITFQSHINPQLLT